MKKILLLAISLVTLFACRKEDANHRTESITKGEKFGIKIGDNAASVYASIQRLAESKGFYDLSVVDQPTYNTPLEIGKRMTLYTAITFELKDVVYPSRVIVMFSDNKVSDISAGSALPEDIAKWPASGAEVINKGDDLNNFYDKLMAIHNNHQLDGYIFRLGSKALNQPYDTAMDNFERWHFSYSENNGERSTFTLYFKNGILEKIYYEYDKSLVVN
ncbi:hypothetical protein [Chitinophaga silvatica]|uniref:hypothetical protein n=1 Tax=Chitinophaga silvatica TaxID=2282649 RepID=UPI001F1A869A|nr:hypothetical protein [Chitinophaga silvatica]